MYIYIYIYIHLLMYIHTLQCYIFSEHYLHAPAVWIPPSARNTVYRSIIVASGFGMFNRSLAERAPGTAKG